MIQSFVDSSGLQREIEECDRYSHCTLQSYWLKRWNPRVCYLKGNRLYLAKNTSSASHDCINLLDPGVVVSSKLDSKGIPFCCIEGCSTSKFKKYNIKFQDADSEWVSLLQNIIEKGDWLKPPATKSTVPYKYIWIGILLEWIVWKDFVRLDSALCSHCHRQLFISWVIEFSDAISRKYLVSILSMSIPLMKWFIQRHLFASRVSIWKDFLFSTLMEKDSQYFAHIKELSCIKDSSALYQALRLSPTIIHLKIDNVSNMSRLIFNVVVYNRSLKSIVCDSSAMTAHLKLIVGLHHKFLFLVNERSSWLVFKTMLWYQECCKVFTIQYHCTVEHIQELKLRTLQLDTLIAKYPKIDIVSPLFSDQFYLMRADIELGVQSKSIADSLSQCSSLTWLYLRRYYSRDDVPFDWTSMTNSKMRLKYLKLNMVKEQFLQHACNILSTTSTLIIEDYAVTDDVLSEILIANNDHLTELLILTSYKLRGKFLLTTSWLGLTNLDISGLPVDPDAFRNFVKFSGLSLMSLTIRADMLSIDSAQLMTECLPKLRYLTVSSSFKEPIGIVEKIVSILGPKLLELQLPMSTTGEKFALQVLAKSIEHCCTVI